MDKKPLLEDWSLIQRMEMLTDEKYDWLECKENQCKEDNERFNLDREEFIWYTMKIAELQLMVEKLK